MNERRNSSLGHLVLYSSLGSSSSKMFLGKFQDLRIKLAHKGFQCISRFHCFPFLKRRISGSVEVLTGVFSNAAPTIGSITWWRQLHKLLPDGKYLMLSYQNLMLKSGLQCPTLLNIGEQQIRDLNLLKKIILGMYNNFHAYSGTMTERRSTFQVYIGLLKP